MSFKQAFCVEMYAWSVCSMINEKIEMRWVVIFCSCWIDSMYEKCFNVYWEWSLRWSLRDVVWSFLGVLFLTGIMSIWGNFSLIWIAKEWSIVVIFVGCLYAHEMFEEMPKWNLPCHYRNFLSNFLVSYGSNWAETKTEKL